MEPMCPAPSTEAHLTQSGTQRQRIKQACKPCHLLKAKCSGTFPTCHRCGKKGIICEYALPKPAPKTRKRRRLFPSDETQQHKTLPSPLPSPRNEVQPPLLEHLGSQTIQTTINDSHKELSRDERGCDPSRELGLEKIFVRLYIDAYFEHISPLFENGFIHRAIFLRAWASGKVDPALLKAVCSASAEFVPSESTTSTRENWRSQAEAYIWSNIGQPSMTVLQVLVLVISQNFALSRFPTLQPLLGIAAKMAFLLRLNHENDKLSNTGREIRRRVMWSIFILERKLAGGQSDLISCRQDMMHIQLPSNEKDFELGILTRTGTLVPEDVDEPSSMGTRAYFCRLSNIRHEVLQYTRRVISEGAKADESRNELLRLENDLVDLRNSLPESMQLNQRNMNFRAYSPHMRRYVMLHTAWHQCHCDLYRFVMPGLRDSLSEEALGNTSAEYKTYCQSRAVKHAKALVGLFQMAQNIGDGTTQDPGIKISVYQCTMIIIRAFDLGLLGSLSIALEILSQLRDAARIMIPLIAMNRSTDQLHNHIQKMISVTIQRASDPDMITQALETEQNHDTNILDILARIRESDIEKGEEVLQDSHSSPVPTTMISSHTAPGTAPTYSNKDTTLGTSSSVRDHAFVEPSWYTGFDSEHLFGSFGNAFDGFEGPFVDFEFQDVDQLYSEQ